MIKFGVSDSLVIPLVLPGAIVPSGFALLWLAVRPDHVSAISACAEQVWKGGTATSVGAIAALVGIVAAILYFFSLVSGLFVAVIGGYVELRILDELYIGEVKVTREAYYKQWYDYVDHLETIEQPNVYIGGLADIFLWLLRTSVALSIVAVFGFGCLYFGQLSLVVQGVAVAALGLAILTFLLARKYHEELADFRLRRFGKSPSTLASVGEIIAELTSLWCDRRALRPLAAILPMHVATNKNVNPATWSTQMTNALSEIAGYGDGSVLPAELIQIERALVMLRK